MLHACNSSIKIIITTPPRLLTLSNKYVRPIIHIRVTVVGSQPPHGALYYMFYYVKQCNAGMRSVSYVFFFSISLLNYLKNIYIYIFIEIIFIEIIICTITLYLSI